MTTGSSSTSRPAADGGAISTFKGQERALRADRLGTAGLPGGSVGYVNFYSFLCLAATSVPAAQLGRAQDPGRKGAHEPLFRRQLLQRAARQLGCKGELPPKAGQQATQGGHTAGDTFIPCFCVLQQRLDGL